jgi:hypothetical protein
MGVVSRFGIGAGVRGAAVAALLCLAACAAQPTSSPAPAGPRDVSRSDRTPACTSPAEYVLSTTANPAVGPGPYRVSVIQVGRYDPERPATAVAGVLVGDITGTVLPKEWRATPPGKLVGEGDDVARVHLIACVVPRPAGATGRITCAYGTGHSTGSRSGMPLMFDIVEGDYLVTMRTASTGETRGEFAVPATATDADSCPGVLGNTPHPTLMRGIDGAKFQEGVATYVRGAG